MHLKLVKIMNYISVEKKKVLMSEAHPQKFWLGPEHWYLKKYLLVVTTCSQD